MKEKFKVGDIIGYKDCYYDNDSVKTIGCIINACVSDSDVEPSCYKIVVLKKNKRHSSLIGKTMTINDYFGTLIKLY